MNASRALLAWALLSLTPLLCAEARAEQPIFDEMPRWNGGWGVQLLHELRTESALLSGDTPVGSGFTEEVFLLHVEGVYTWTKALRLTVKLPMVLRATRTLPDAEVALRTERDSGIGDPTIALPLKSYFNLDGRSGSFTFTPQIKVPTASRGEGFDVFDRILGNGVSLGYSTETYRYHLGASASGWVYYDAREPAEATLSLNLGLNIHVLNSSGHIKWKTSALYETDGSLTLSAGPILYWRFSDTWHGQLQWKRDVYDRQGTLDHGEGDSLRAGLGVVF